MPNKTANIVTAATYRALAPYKGLNQTVTNDNGTEFQQAETLEAKLGAPVYFTDPSAPWQRGSVENINGLIRQYAPKGTKITKQQSWITEALEDTLNFRPRKSLDYRTPHEKFFQEKLKLCEGELMHFGLKCSSPS